MEILAERLDAKLREWRPDIAELVKRRVAEIIDLGVCRTCRLTT
jgi:hypothetical protein